MGGKAWPTEAAARPRALGQINLGAASTPKPGRSNTRTGGLALKPELGDPFSPCPHQALLGADPILLEEPSGAGGLLKGGDPEAPQKEVIWMQTPQQASRGVSCCP